MRISRPLLTSGAVVTALALGLTGCGSKDKDKDAKDADKKSGSCAKVDSGDASDAVKVTGKFGEEQKIDFKSPLKVTGLERTVITKGDGKEAVKDDKVNVLLTVASGKTGKTFGTSPAEFPVGDKSIPKAFAAGVECLAIGTRAVVTVPAKDVYGAQGNPQVGIKADDTLVIVTDVIEKAKKPVPPALPKVSEWKDAPKVSFDKAGKPTVKLPGKPSKTLELKVLEEGDGAEVKSGDSVTVDYQGTSWDTGKIFDQSFGGSPATFTTDGVVPGFGAALVGQKVGSKVIVTIPPKYAYGEKGTGQQLSGQTLVFVIDIKDTKSS